MDARTRRPRLRLVVTTAIACALGLAAVGGTASAAPRSTKADTITVLTLPIANGLPLDLGIKKGFFANQGIEIKKTILQSGNDIVLALANGAGQIGYVGYVPAMIARTQGIAVSVVAASEVEGTSDADNWQDILVKGSSSIKTPADLSGKTIAVNALKGVGETVIKAALQKKGVDPNSVKLLALPFPQMRSALNNGQVDAIWVPEPFLSLGLNTDGDRIVLSPGPTLGKYFPNGGYVGLHTLDDTLPGPREALQDRDQPVAALRAESSGRDQGAASRQLAEHPSADLEPADRSQATADAREVREAVRRDHDAAELHAARPDDGQDRCRQEEEVGARRGGSPTRLPPPPLRSGRERCAIAPADEQSIRTLVERWAVWRDAGDWERFRTVWHDDGRMMATWFQGPADEFIAASREGFERGVSILHFLGGTAVDLAGDRAIAQTKMTISQRTAVHGVECDVVCTGRFYDFLERRDGLWGIVLRQPIYEKDRLDPLDPAARLELDRAALERLPVGYRHLGYAQEQAGFTVKRDLPGLQGPEVDALYASGAGWLAGEPLDR